MRFLSVREAATVVRVSVKTIRRGLGDRQRPLKHYRLGARRIVISEADLLAWMELHACHRKPSPAVLDRMSPDAKALLEKVL